MGEMKSHFFTWAILAAGICGWALYLADIAEPPVPGGSAVYKYEEVIPVLSLTALDGKPATVRLPKADSVKFGCTGRAAGDTVTGKVLYMLIYPDPVALEATRQAKESKVWPPEQEDTNVTGE